MVAAAFALPALSAVAGAGSAVRQTLPPSSGAPAAFATRGSDFLGRSLSLPTAGAGAALPSPAGGSSPSVFCGRGDRKTEKGKRFNHSYGNARPRDKKKGRGPPRVEVPPAPPRKDKYDDGEIVKIEIDESLFS